jgi:FkbM family methyltransferase
MMQSTETLAVIVAKGQISDSAMANITLHPPFASIEVIEIEQGNTPADDLNSGIDRAIELNASWMFFMAPGEDMNPNAISFLSLALDGYDALWGGIALVDDAGTSELAKKSQFSSSDMVGNFHMALQWWVGKSHFVRTDVANKSRFDRNAGNAWYADYLVRMWESARCLKSAQALTSTQSELPKLSDDDRDYLAAHLRDHPKYINFQYRSHQIYFPYTGRNPTLERLQLRGLFYEQSDLEALIPHVKPGAICVDVGANTGNHTIFFDKILRASKVIPLEPNPDTIEILKDVIEKNNLTAVDASKLGVGVGRTEGRFELNVGLRGYLGTARLEPEQSGSIRVLPLDLLIDDDVDFMKIDVEMMEIDVLEGARALISRCQPVLLIEVQDENCAALFVTLNNLDYCVVNVFPDQGYANYLALPKNKD